MTTRNSKTIAAEIEDTLSSGYEWSCSVCGHGTGKEPCPMSFVSEPLTPKFWSKGYDGHCGYSPVWPHDGKSSLTAEASKKIEALETELAAAKSAEADSRDSESRDMEQESRERATAEGAAWLDSLCCFEHGKGVCPGGKRWDGFIEAHVSIRICRDCGAEEGTCIHG